ncbi:MAG: glycosyltransferase family 4 protein [Methanomassiliicoccus sp.]|nr:glycosyltransferase family 4 protein [Methanomassiliicoccus sp.]
MRVAMVTPEFLSWGGVGSYVVQLAKNLTSDHEVHVICLDNGGEVPKVDNITVHTLGTAKDTFMYNNQFQISLWRSFSQLNDAHHFDLLHANHAQMADLMFKVLGERIPSVTTVHSTIGSQRMGTKEANLTVRQLESSERMTLFLLPVLKTLERMYMSRCSSLIYVSDFIRAWCQEKLGADCPSKVIHNGIDTTMFHPKGIDECLERFPTLKGVDNIVLFSGRMIALKGISTALNAVKLVDRKHDPTFVFAGNGNAEQWKAMASGLGISPDRCRFIGPVPYKNMPYLYPLASAFMLPSYSESFPMTLLESMACGTPVIATDVGGVPEMIEPGSTGLLVPPKNATALAEGINTILGDPRLARSMCMRARDRVLNEFSASVMAQRTAEVYKSTVDGWS